MTTDSELRPRLVGASLTWINLRTREREYILGGRGAERRPEEEQTMKTILRTRDLSCPSCATKIEATLQAMNGVSHAKAHFTTGRIVVEHDPGRIGEDVLARSVAAIGYDVQRITSDG